MNFLKSNYISYYSKDSNKQNWIISEKKLALDYQGKFETILSIGNGYISSRASHEENFGNKRPGTFITGTFNTVSGPEVPEIPNAADVFEFSLKANDKIIDCSRSGTKNYNRFLDIKDGLLVKEYDYLWKEKDKKFTLNVNTERFISLDNLNLLMQRITLKTNQKIDITFKSGINGQTTNSGANHFEDTYSQYLDNVINYIFTTTNSKIHFFYHKHIKFYINKKNVPVSSLLSSVYGYSRRTLRQIFNIHLQKNDVLEIELYSTINTSNDLQYLNSNQDYSVINNDLNKNILKLANNNYDFFKSNHIKKWHEYWKENEIIIETKENFDILSTRFAQYQTRKFTPYHDPRCNIEAKGMVGEEYKGHTFWDTEIFIFTYFLYTQPKIAKQLLMHRDFVKNSAIIKAKENNYKGYMWPWETSWQNDGETCPTWGAVDRKEGHRIKVWPAYNQHHIASCIFWAFDQYYKVSDDLEFMQSKGFNILINTALFWSSRLEWNETKKLYEITKVTGPNEYKENIDNNVFTNYMAWFCIKRSIEYIEFINNKNLKIEFLNDMSLAEIKTKLLNVRDKIYLPQPNKNMIIPENDTFLKLKEIDTVFYKKNPDQLWKDYTFPELNQYQILKQADAIALFYTLGFLFTQDIIEKNWKYYEQRCLHHSSLSLSLHAVTANYIDDKLLAYTFFEKSTQIDLGNSMTSCDNGIHSASIGGILKIVIEGFGGLRNWNDKFYITPNLPKKWNSLKFNFYIYGQKILMDINHETVTFKNLSKDKKEINFNYRDKSVSLLDSIKIDY
ncbi:MAG: glycosyl hydrolase family 65 protein [Malacoplasma sp.]